MSVQSVIQQNQQSVIQTTSHAASHLQAVQLPKGGVILLNKNTGSVIQPTGGGHLQTIQVATLSEAEEMAVVAEEESKKRREILARRPSYRKILNDLSSADSPAISSDVKEESSMSESSNDGNDTMNTITVAGISDGSIKGGDQEYIVVPAGAIQMATGSQGEAIQGLQTLTMTNAGGGAAGTIVQYAQGQDGQFFVPVTVSAADLQAYQIRASGGNGNQSVVVTQATNLHSPQQADDASRKRELRLLKNRSRTQSRIQPDSCYNAENGSNSQVNIRLLKNREAARECRRKKKEYIKCLENRVAVLENQNKALIEELKSLKELYCQKND